MTSTPASWKDFAETFFASDEDCRRHAFLVRNAIHFLDSADVSIVKMRIAQSAIPEVADGCLLVPHADNGDWEDAVTAHRYSEEEAAFRALRKLPHAITDALLATSSARTLPPSELADLAKILPSLSAAIVVPFGSAESPTGFAFFFQTRSERAFPPSVAHLARDLVQHGESAIQHARMTESLRREVRTREKFISIASHELKTPLTALKLQLDSLRRGFLRDGESLSKERIEKAFHTLDRSMQRLTQSIGMLFSLSEIRAGQVGLLKEPSDLAQLIRDVAGRMDMLMGASGCKLTLDLPESVPAFFDARRIEQAIINLLANAAKYAPRTAVEVALAATDERARIEIRDHGPGIPAKDHERIFEAFNRGSAQSAVEGLGLGLFVTQGVVRAHGGTLSLVSAPGEGARFAIEVPRWLA